MRTLNLAEFIELKENGTPEEFDNFKKLNLKEVKESEIEGLEKLYYCLADEVEYKFLSGFIFGEKLSEGSNEEFDLLRFTDEGILNIELKREVANSKIEKAVNQAKRHKLLLSQSGLKVTVFTFVSNSREFYSIDDNGEYMKVPSKRVSEKLKVKHIMINPLDTINMKNLIISPYSCTTEFVNHEYFLTDEQLRVKNEIFNDTQYRRHSVVGGPGTGKSIVLFDLAKKYKRLNKEVLVIFAGNLPESSEMSMLLGFDIISITEIDKVAIDSYDIVLIDESQRLYKHSFNAVNGLNPEKLIFFIDHSQVLHPNEEQLYIEKILYDDNTVANSKLKYKIRTDKKMSAFIKKFMNKNTRSANLSNIENINVNYFCTKENLQNHVQHMVLDHNYTAIELTEYRTKSTSVIKKKHLSKLSESVHNVVGREFDNVLVVIDDTFTYDIDGNLKSTYNDYYPCLTENCIFEALTRVKNKLNIVILNNNEIYTHVQKMLIEGF